MTHLKCYDVCVCVCVDKQISKCMHTVTMLAQLLISVNPTTIQFTEKGHLAQI